MNFKSIRKRTRGQTTLEYALVIAVIAVGVIILSKAIFGSKDGAADKLMRNAVESAQGTFKTE
jgi:Flp pilus assembly pilin Flp